MHELRSIAESAGCAGFGICSVEPFDDVADTMAERDRSGFRAGLTFTYADPAAATDVRRSFPWARFLVVLAHGYLPEAGSSRVAPPGTGRIARFATDDHYRPLRAALAAVAEALTGLGHRAEPLCDDNRLVDRAAAVRSGVAWWGKSTMALTPGHGPWVLLGSVATDAALPATEPMQRTCGTCDACLPACPTGALTAAGVLDARRCLAHLLQARGDIPIELRTAVGSRIYGCDDCLDACPPGARAADAAVAVRGVVDLIAFLEASDEELLERHAHFYIPGRKPRYLRRNALVALGNNPAKGAHRILARYLHDPDPMLRRHAAWALGRTGGEQALRSLCAARDEEPDPSVVAEIDRALLPSAAVT